MNLTNLYFLDFSLLNHLLRHIMQIVLKGNDKLFYSDQ